MPEGGPWDPKEPETPPPRRPRGPGLLWLVMLAVVAALVLLLFKAFPGAVQSTDDWSRVAYAAGLVALVSAGLIRTRRIDWGQRARQIAGWIGVVAVLAVGFAYRDELGAVGQRVRSEFSSGYPVATAPREVVVSQDDNGSFFVMGRVNGQLVRFLVDTGASDTVLSPADAERLGIDTSSLSFDRAAETANGVGYGARYKADSLAVGPILLSDVPMVINKAPMTSSLLGLTFLGRLDSFQVRGHRLYLKGRAGAS
ncbi:TIGR02281 family clan AA aspartic protease [Phenylobacterium sp.]|uniref:retropepsin-like aspartic protease family protein n=1 Tax=Phenylobacterium sp. TaxID=1871053 RepID=UPI00356325C3